MSFMLIFSIIVAGIIVTIIGLVVILKKTKRRNDKKNNIDNNEVEENYKFDFSDLMHIIKNPNTKSEDLLNALIYFNENFSIDKDNSKQYFIFLSRILTHPNRTKNIFTYFHKEVKYKNRNFKNELEVIEKKALG